MSAFEVRALDVHDDVAATGWYGAVRTAAVAGWVAPLVVTERALLTSLRRTDDDRYYDRHVFGAWARGRSTSRGAAGGDR